MYKRFLLIITVLLFISIIAPDISYAKDDKTYYGDGTAAAWEDIAQYLSPLYKNTPYINISNGKEVRKFYFNIELFMDLGLYVYGEPASVQFTGAVNDFTKADYGYFIENANIKGEFRYLGYSVSGVAMTNVRFPNEMDPDASEMVLMRYTDLPDALKVTYNIVGVNNNIYSPIRDLIDADDSPVWDFENLSYGAMVTLRSRFDDFGLLQNGRPSVSIFDYGVIYSWAETGGSVRIFYHPKNNSEAIRYATFTGPVSIDHLRKVPAFTSSISVSKDNPAYIGSNTFIMKQGQSYLQLQLGMQAVFADNFARLTDFGKQYTYTRQQMKSVTLTAQNNTVNDAVTTFEPNEVITSGSVNTYKIFASSLSPGWNAVRLFGIATLQLDGRKLISQCETLIYIQYDIPVSPSSLPSTPTPVITPYPSHASAKPSPTPYYEIFRKW